MKKNNNSKKLPLVSIITPSFNQGEFLDDCVKSILKQTYKNIEHIVIDGKSTDDTIEKLKKYKHIKWITENDSGYWDAVTKGVKMAKGKYIMICMVSDGYINNDWIRKCVDILENDKEVSMVWGFPRWLEGEKFTDICYAHFHNSKVPQKYDWLPYWLKTAEALPNGNFCIHKKVFEKCNTVTKKTPKGEELYILNYNFNTLGYLPYNIPEVAEFSRAHPGQIGESWTKNGLLPRARKKYEKQIIQYKKSLLTGKKIHLYRDRSSKPLRYKPYLKNMDLLNVYLLRCKIFMHLLSQRGPGKIKNKIFKKRNINNLFMK
jgi:glycosyltransferase involved in cell wall biosynthesis